MGVIVTVMSRTMQSFIYIALLLFLFIFIYALLGMQLYGGRFNFRDNNVRQNFDSFPSAFISVFQIMTIENWNQLLYVALRSDALPIFTFLYFISWIFIGNFVFLNLFLAILLDGFTQDTSAEEKLEEMEILKEI